MLKTVVFELV